jgi:hypothetical protein
MTGEPLGLVQPDAHLPECVLASRRPIASIMLMAVGALDFFEPLIAVIRKRYLGMRT